MSKVTGEKIMENRIPSMEERRGDGPQRIGDILKEWMARYGGSFPAARITGLQKTPPPTEDRSISPCPTELAMT
jgi:hypothetical protein